MWKKISEKHRKRNGTIANIDLKDKEIMVKKGKIKRKIGNGKGIIKMTGKSKA